MTQLELTASYTRTEPESFEAWARRNANVVDEFCRRALALRREGRSHYGAKTIAEKIRNDSAVAERGADFKINNNRVADLARLAMSRHPELAGFFAVRGR